MENIIPSAVNEPLPPHPPLVEFQADVFLGAPRKGIAALRERSSWKRLWVIVQPWRANPMTGRERILAALNLKQPDRVPLFTHGINEGPVIGIGQHLTEGLPQPKQFHDMTDMQKLKLLDTLFLIHEHFGVDGFTSFEIGHEVELDK